MRPRLSVVAPCFNEEDSITEFLAQLRAVLDQLGETYEVIVVNDGSSDGTLSKLKDHDWKQMSFVSFPINLGHQAALDAGYRKSSGDYVLTMDSDLQHPPSIIPKLLEALKRHQVEVVFATRKQRREDSPLKRFTAKRYYGLMRGLTGIPIQDSAADFRIVTRKVVSTINALPPGGKVFRLLIPSLGFTSKSLNYEASARFAGKTKYSISRMVGLLITSIVSFSTRPLWLSIQLGFAFAFLALVNLFYTIGVFLSGETVPGWASTSAAILILFSINFLVLGVLGLYVGELLRTLKGDAIAGQIIARSVEN